MAAALAEAGGLRFDLLGIMPPTIADRAPRPGDDRFVTLTARRPVLEQVLGRAAEEQAGLDVRRGVRVARLDCAHRRRDRARRRRRHRGRRAAGGGPRRRRDGPPLTDDRVARRHRGRADPRGGRGLRLRLLHAVLSLARRRAAAVSLGAADADRHVHGPRPAQRQRHVVGDAVHLRRRPAAEAAARPRPLGRGARGLPGARPVARGRAAHRRAADGRDPRPLPPRRRRRPAGRDRGGAARRRLGVHEPVRRPRDVAGDAARAAPARSRARGDRGSAALRARLGRAHGDARDAVVSRHRQGGSRPPAADRGAAQRCGAALGGPARRRCGRRPLCPRRSSTTRTCSAPSSRRGAAGRRSARCWRGPASPSGSSRSRASTSRSARRARTASSCSRCSPRRSRRRAPRRRRRRAPTPTRTPRRRR